jgi:hypothetical protein
MTNPQNAFADLAQMTQRGQTAAADMAQAWTTTVSTVTDAAGSQASSLRRLTRGLFDLADQAVAVERELATFLTVNAQVSAAALDSFRKLTDTATAALEDVTSTTAWLRP